ncbi:maleylpyruvate isomerase family mycothiol-dependent enzyme [Dactylosporangium sp. CS-033363]|uniref:maleylpyruvate isomerase family mycothiol-dependent enzyme n=1 Tax=Dactylosporangium sp. CS-033363 TaxID=3239935 RepID=UPI003D8F2058
MEFPALLRLIDERSKAFHAAIAAAPSLGVPVPTCPGWTLFDLAQHLSEGRRKWAGIVDAGPSGEPVTPSPTPAPRIREALLFWLDATTRELLHSLERAGPERGCWTWWESSETPQNAGSVARRQLHEVAVHTYDAQAAIGAPQPLPEAIALDGVDEFLATCCAGAYHWPHPPAALDYRATEGRSWRLALSADEVQLIRDPSPDSPADATVRGAASELVLVLYCRIPIDAVQVEGDRRQFDLLIDWEPDA